MGFFPRCTNAWKAEKKWQFLLRREEEKSFSLRWYLLLANSHRKPNAIDSFTTPLALAVFHEIFQITLMKLFFSLNKWPFAPCYLITVVRKLFVS